MKQIRKKALLSLFVDVPVNFVPVVVGKVCSAYGVLGWLKVISFTEKSSDIMNYHPWYIKLFEGWCCLNLIYWKKHEDCIRFIIKCKDIDNRDIAKLLSNKKMFVDVSKFPILSFGEYYWRDIVGCQVISIRGYVFGSVINLIETGSNDVLVVKSEQYSAFDQTFLIPVIHYVVKSIDFLGRIIYVDWNPKF